MQLNSHIEYRTGLWLTKNIDSFQDSFKGRGWSLSFAKDVSDHPKFNNGSEVIITAKKWETAQQALNLISAGMVLVDGYNVNVFSNSRHIAFNEDALEGPEKLTKLQRPHFYTPSIPIACKIAIKASYKLKHCYALTKYFHSCEHFSTPSIDLDPFHSPNMKVSGFYEDHVRFAASIFTAYSAIEELNLHIKASPQKPSRLEDGSWNPEVKADLEERLVKSKINLHEPFLWSIRGPKRRIDKKRSPTPKEIPSWSRWPVNDINVEITDAIADASWLRSRVSAHGFSKLASSLSPYDVANVQHLARRLILESLGYWRYMG
jgi:hypothetical protein